MDLETREERVLVSDPGREDACHWTPVGRAIVYRAHGDGDLDVHLAVLGEDSTRALTHLNSFDQLVPTFIWVPSLAALSRRAVEPEPAGSGQGEDGAG